MSRLQKAGPVRGSVVFPVRLAETDQQIGQAAGFTEIQIMRLHDIPALKSRVLDVVLLEHSGGLLHRVPELLGAKSAHDMAGGGTGGLVLPPPVRSRLCPLHSRFAAFAQKVETT